MKIIFALIVTILIGSQTPVLAQINNQPPTQLAIVENQQVTDPIVVNPIPNETTTVETPPATVVETVQEIPVSDNEAKAFIYYKESTNRLDAVNEIGACGLGQSLPCSKLENDCPDWRTNYACQDAWFTNYMTSRYGTWQNAQDFWLRNHWW